MIKNWIKFLLRKKKLKKNCQNSKKLFGIFSRKKKTQQKTKSKQKHILIDIIIYNLIIFFLKKKYKFTIQ